MSTLSSKKFNGATNIAAGITKGIQVLTSASARQPSLVAPQAAAEDIIIHTITFGEANPTEMQAIADATGGNHYIAPDAAALQAIFEEIALTLPVVFTD
jgi:hypothetical protein